jgi:hypothetical protein
MFTDQDRQSVAYAICVSGVTAADIASRQTTGSGVLVDTAARASFALMTAQRLAPATKQKLLFHAATISESEIIVGLHVIREIYPALDQSEALRVFAAARMEIAHNPARYRVITIATSGGGSVPATRQQEIGPPPTS